MSARRAAVRRAARDGGIPQWQNELRPVRGRCTATLGRSRRVCGSRYAVRRVSLDLTSRERVDRLATLECVACGAVWRRVRAPERVTTRDGYPTSRLDLILPSEQRRWFARGRYHVTGEDAVTLRDATVGDLMAAMDDWRSRNGQLLASRQRAEARREAQRAADHAATMALLDRLHARDAEREAEERAAAEREAA